MFKTALLAIAPLMLFACSVHADDDLLTAIAKLDTDNHAVAQVDSATDSLGQADVDGLLGDDQENDGDAIAACYRRFSGHGGGYGHSYGSYGGFSNFGHRSYCYSPCYNHYSTYSPCYSPSYTYCAPSYTYYTPSYSCYTPCYTSYWGCN